MRAFLPCSRKSSYSPVRLLSVVVLGIFPLCLAGQRLVGQSQQGASVSATPRPLITEAIDETRITTLKGNTHPLARPVFDLGTAPASLPMERMLLVLKRSADQERSLRKLLDDQQDKHSLNYHKWMTPEQFGAQFGPTDADMQTIKSWLQSHGFQVGSTKGRTVLEFSGSASQVQEAFHTSIHKYVVNGQQHWANASDPSIPTALTPAVAGIASLNDFPRRAMHSLAGRFTRDSATGKIKPDYTYPGGCVENNFDNGACLYGLGPYDFATIYDVQPLWTAGINGTGQTIAIVGESNINIQDVADFRSMFGLPVNNPNIILNGPDPGIQGDESEADIDVQWSGAVAPNATIDFVVSQSTETTAGIDLSATYIVENNLAPVMSESYGQCELGLGTTGNQFYNTLWQQAAAEGITVFVSAGDNGAAGCDNFDASPPAPAEFGLQVSGFASTPYNVAVGGTDFNDFSNPSTYWSTTNNSTTQASALSYIPEIPWNDSCTNPLFASLGFSTVAETNCNDGQLINFVLPEGGSGGVSKCTTPSGSTPASCAGGYAKPTWQSGPGVPADGKRDIPDVSLFASNGFLGSFYIICQSDQTGNACNVPGGEFLGFGGTSVSSPAFAGIMALVNQQTGSRQGNANYVLYKLASQQPTAFHDITTGTNTMPCATGSTNCTTSVSGDAYGVLSGYNAGANYDLATGLGSVDANILVTKWNTVTLLPSTTMLTNVTPTTITHGQSVGFTATVKPSSGTGTPTGLVSLEGGPTDSSEGIAGFNLTSGTVTGNTELLPGGTYSLIAHYPGDSTYGPSDSGPVSVTVNKENSTPQVFLVTFNSNGTLLNGNTNTATYGSPYVLRVNVENSAGKMCAPAASSGATACPTGNVTLTNNGSPLDAGTYVLNSDGYFEDLAVQLPGGTDSVKAAYAGDNSFNTSSSISAISITPAPTTMTTPQVQYWSVGENFITSVIVQAQSTGVAPTGTVTFLVNGTPVTGTTSYQGTAGSSSNPTASLSASFSSNSSVFPVAGTYAITATYSGDSNYGSSSSQPYSVTVKYPSPALSMSPSAVTVAAGASVTVSAIIDTNLKNVPTPTGTVPFINWGPLTPIVGTETYTTITDSTGNVALQASITFVPAANVEVGASYAGDTNYPSAGGGGLTFVTVTGSDFTLIPMSTSITLSPGQHNGFLVFVQGQSNYNGTINFTSASCSGLPKESTCSFSPASLTGTGSTNFTVTTTAPQQTARRSSVAWAVGLSLPLSCVLLISLRRRGSCVFLLVFLLALLTLLPSCGGGGGSGTGGGGGGGGGGTTDPGTPTGSYTVTLTATSGSLSHSFNFMLIVE